MVPARPSERQVIALASLALLAVALGIVLFTTLRSPLKDDIAWLLYVARRWMTGRELYVDVVEVNPPLIVWISAIPVLLADWLDVGGKFVAVPFFISIVLGCAWWTASLLRGAGGMFVPRGAGGMCVPRGAGGMCVPRGAGGMFDNRIPVFAVISTVLLVVPGGDLGQREHLLVAAVLPYLVLFARSLDGVKPGRVVAVLASVLAGLGCALKPRYAAVFVALETVAMLRGLPYGPQGMQWRGMQWRPWRLMPVVAAATMLAYGGLVVLVCPAYLNRAVPLALALYGGTDVPFTSLLDDSARLLFGEGVAIALCLLRWRKLRERNLLLTLLVFAVTSTVICFVDGKDWFYHRLPATVVTILALMCWGVSILIYRTSEERRTRLPVVAAIIAMQVFMVGTFQRIEPAVTLAVDPAGNPVTVLENLIQKEHARTYVAFSEWLALGFPVVNNTGVRWASRFDSMWALKGELWRARFDPNTAKEWPIAHWVVHDFITGCPDLAVVDTRETVNYIAVLSAADPAFVRAWSHYRLIAEFAGLTVYRRSPGGCINPWVAAESNTAAGG